MEDEISLKECIEVLLKSKKMIIIITVVSIILGFITCFAMPKSYEATATLLTNPINGGAAINTDSLGGLINSTSQYSHMDVTTYVEQILSSDVLTKTIQELNLTNSNGEYITVRQLIKKIQIDNPEDTNIIYVTVKDKDAQLAANIANTICKYFSQFISELTRSQGLASAESIASQMEIEKANLDKEAQRLRDYLTNSKSIEVLQSEISSIMSQLSTYKIRLIDVQTSIETEKSALKVLLDNKSSDLNLNLDDINVNLSTGEFEFAIQDSNKLQDAMMTMEITNKQTSLNTHLASEKILKEKIDEMEKRLIELQSTLAEEQYNYNSIQRDYDLAQSTYTTYQDKYKEATIAAASDIGRVTIQLSTSAIAPEDPSGVSKVVILGIFAVMGFVIAVFVAFFKSYWKSAEKAI